MTRQAVAFLVVFAVVAAMSPREVRCQESMDTAQHRSGGLGFHDIDAPLGGRWWLSGQRVGVDLGIGFQSETAPSYSDENLTRIAFSVGVPIVLKSWNRVHVAFRPGVFHETRQAQATSPPEPFDTEDQTTLRITGEIEVEAFLLDQFSVSASHGIGWNRFDPGFGAEDETSFGTLGHGFTEIGFHVYLFGSE